MHPLRQGFLKLSQMLKLGCLGDGAQLGGSRGRGGSQIGTKIRDGEIGFMADTADHRHLAGHDGTGQSLVIEGPQIFHRPTATHQQNHVDVRPVLQRVQCPNQLGWGLRTLHQTGRNAHRDVRHAPLQSADHIMQSCGPQGGDHPDAAGALGDVSFALGMEQTLGLQLGLEPQKSFMQLTGTGRSHGFGHQLQFATRFVQCNPTLDLDQIAVTRLEIQILGRSTKHGAAHLTLIVFQGEITVPTRSAREPRDLALNGHRVEAGFEGIADGMAQTTDRPHAAGQRGRGAGCHAGLVALVGG